ncbi:ubiquitin-related domain-containing protein [Thamnidium elegans]|nr:ubiquitin-related domain-containing protein [Thamnidium elegans]
MYWFNIFFPSIYKKKFISTMIIYLKVETSEPSGAGIPFNVSPDNTTKELKEAIRTKLRMAAEGYFLLYSDKVMEDNKSIKNYGILPESAIYLVARVYGGMQIFLKHMGGTCTAIQVNDTTTIAELKQIYGSKTGIGVNEQRLLYGGQQLEDTYKMMDYKIVADSAIHVVFRLRGGSPSITQKLINMNGTKALSLSLNNRNRYAVKDLKIKNSCVYGIPEKEQHLYYNGRSLEDAKMFTYYRMKKNLPIVLITSNDYF